MTPQFNPHSVAQTAVANLKQNFGRAILFVYNELGMECVRIARLSHNYNDRTGNLTNSMGYAVFKGKSVAMSGGTQGNGEGAMATSTLISDLATANPYDYSLVIAAGMQYAAYVEAYGFNVLLPAKLHADKVFMHRFKALCAKYSQRLKNIMQ